MGCVRKALVIFLASNLALQGVIAGIVPTGNYHHISPRAVGTEDGKNSGSTHPGRCDPSDSMCLKKQELSMKFRKELVSTVTRSLGEVMDTLAKTNVTINLLKSVTGGRHLNATEEARAENQVVMSLVSSIISFLSSRVMGHMSRFVQRSMRSVMWDMFNQMVNVVATQGAKSNSISSRSDIILNDQVASSSSIESTLTS